ncbi:ARPP-1 family domain-containing protein [Chondromyces apiculatus]|uniref:ARG and Rhodanese-Phosphatase-superfamily-associated domain-containing protein n=1 Tax=Chondromyces apiculatus DSM 436 TaxID=1192034 RepID=A0A017SVX1_9BACT|nr:DUF6569 family protein [Chondromyces apiculatus]EYF01118.1 Hypothetical protein CAP_8623 [Chondromyces apiculatus DSM 436]
MQRRDLRRAWRRAGRGVLVAWSCAIFLACALLGCSRRAPGTGGPSSGAPQPRAEGAAQPGGGAAAGGSGTAGASPGGTGAGAAVGKRAPKQVPGHPIGDGYTVGAPQIFDNLAVFPVYASVQEDLGEFTTLDVALEKETAVVRELGAAPVPPPAPPTPAQAANTATAEPPTPSPQPSPPPHPRHPRRHPRLIDTEDHEQSQRAQHAVPSDVGAQVNTLVIENKGDLPILVLAGTIVKGGKQDRQIGQDFLVGARQTVPVDAFCVEHGRWTGIREGASTDGKFSTMKVLASAKVREAGQYKRDQGEVWSKVSEFNRAHRKETASDTMVAAVEDGAVARQREALAGKASAWLGSVPSVEDVVGLAYAVDGQVRGVRFFMNRKLFQMFEATLTGTAAQDAITAAEEARAQHRPVASGAADEQAVTRFIAGIASAKAEAQATRAGNVNHYQVAEKGYGSAVFSPAAAQAAPAAPAELAEPDARHAPPAPLAKPKAITRDFLAK